jgi:5-methylcytosine-specific restriction endonuclease McrA
VRGGGLSCRTVSGNHCEVDGCSGPALTRGLCGAHYKRWRLYGDPLHTAKTMRLIPEVPMCHADGCDARAVSKGYCDKHYRRFAAHGTADAPEQRTTCSVEGCPWPHKSGGLCMHHLDRLKRWGNALAGKPVPPLVELCDTEGCGRPRYALGLCNGHYRARAKAAKPSSFCCVDGCGKREFSLGWCQAHYRRNRSHGDPNRGRRSPVDGRACAVKGCSNPYFANDYCTYHWGQMRYHGDPMMTVYEPGRICVMPNCDRPHRAAGYCAIHYVTYMAGPRRRRRAAEALGECPGANLIARMEFWGYRCWICAGDVEAIDHVKPLAAGGSNWPANLRPVCRSCNSSKGSRWYGVGGLAGHAAKIKARKRPSRT